MNKSLKIRFSLKTYLTLSEIEAYLFNGSTKNSNGYSTQEVANDLGLLFHQGDTNAEIALAKLLEHSDNPSVAATAFYFLDLNNQRLSNKSKLALLNFKQRPMGESARVLTQNAKVITA